MEAVQKSYEEMLDLFARGATPAQILAFRPSQEAQQRVQYLLAQNKAGAPGLRQGNRGLHNHMDNDRRDALREDFLPPRYDTLLS